MVKNVPIWWAPNAITFVGFILVILAEIIIYSTGKLGDSLSNLQLLTFSILIFIYQTLDNIDGKQARRTGTSTALGMLMDHGCDAMSCFFLCNCVIRIVGITDEKLAIFGTYTILFIFYLSVWAQYYSNGVMSLGKINAVDDGIPAVYCLAIITIFTGQ
jgi:ethanolaminephosphotransferase